MCYDYAQAACRTHNGPVGGPNPKPNPNPNPKLKPNPTWKYPRGGLGSGSGLKEVWSTRFSSQESNHNPQESNHNPQESHLVKVRVRTRGPD